ncbi:hypothetical protein L2719_15540 [Shewanella schlegeliana]|uniref:Porin n=1 Tax=Shewanella schlegeliana TaxID=190308 RepID=A0ABS1T332_9GAMM|nr:hypothetical protein [Shewanella schlegeliana]MBL4915187.1 hypothetical protein [Shewanella schlegeliana]MCL1110945.1 hypothetical protein [Shewanella schlegeliana]GIU29499.1 hypothetical protein TUM4433_18890 [Shewanella schlegeliana]
MKNRTLTVAVAVATPLSISSIAFAEENEIQDMSDPLAVYTQLGASYGTNGINFKLGKTLDTGSATDMSMFLFEVKGLYGEHMKHQGASALAPENANNGVSELRFRKFDVDMTTGRGISMDVIHNFNANSGTASVGMIQALPKVGVWQAFPIIAAGVEYNDGSKRSDTNEASGLHSDFVFASFTLYNKFLLTDTIWANYNPIYTQAIFGNEHYTENLKGSNGLTHEFILSWQMTPTQNFRLWYNASQNQFADGDFRLEYNQQF